MKLFNHLGLALIGSAILSTACTKDGEAPRSAQVQTDTNQSVGELTLTLSAEYEQQRSRSLSYDVAGGTNKISGSDNNYQTHVFIRSADGTKQFYATMQWNELGRSGGNLQLEGKPDASATALNPPAGYTRLQLTPSAGTASADLPKAGETWYISALLGGGEINASKDAISLNNANGSTEDGTTSFAYNQAQMPYATESWTAFKVGVADDAPEVKLHFKPQGVQLLFDVEPNERIGSQKPRLPQARLITNHLSDKGIFDFKTSTTSLSDTELKFKFDQLDNAENVDTLQRRLSGHNGKYYALLWGMPRSLSGEGATALADIKSRPCVNGYVVHHPNNTTGQEHGLRTTAFNKGETYTIPLKIFRPRMSLELLAEYNLRKNTGKFDTEHRMTNDETTQHFYWSEAQTYENGRRIEGNSKMWRLPEEYEFFGIYLSTNYEGVTQRAWLKPNKAPYIHLYKTLGDYKDQSLVDEFYVANRNERDALIYAVRFAGSNNAERIAYRYQIHDVKNGDNAGITVSSKYIGADPSFSRDNLLNEAFWSTSDVTSRTFPYIGFRTKGAPNQWGYRNVSDIWLQGQSFTQSLSTAWFNIKLEVGNLIYLFPIRLTRVHCCDLDNDKVGIHY